METLIALPVFECLDYNSGVLQFVIFTAVGVAVGLSWLALWAVVLRGFGLPVWVEAVVKFIFGALFFGCWVGFNAWDKLFRDPNPLPTTLLLRNETRPVSAVPVFLG